MDEKELQALYNAVNSKFDVGGYDQFKSKMSTPDQRKNFYNVVSEKGFDLGDFDEYEKRIGGKKKRVGSISLDGSSLEAGDALSGGESGSTTSQTNEIPTIEMYGGDLDFRADDYVGLAKKSNELANTKKTVTETVPTNTYDLTGSMQPTTKVTEVVDEDAKKKADDINAYLEKAGYDPKRLNADFKDIPEDVLQIKGLTKPELLSDYKNNPPLYNRKIATIKAQTELKDVLPDEEWNRVKSNYNNANVGDYAQQRANVKDIVRLANEYGGDKKDDILRNIGTDFANVYAQAAADPKQFDILDPVTQKLNANQAAAYHFLQDTNPKLARQLQYALIDDNEIKGNDEAQLAKQEAGKRLDEIGINLQRNYANEKRAPMLQEYQTLYDKKEAGTATPQDEERMNELMTDGAKYNQILQNTDEDEKNLVAHYPKAAYLDANNFAQELIGQKHTGLDWMLTETGKATGNTIGSIQDIATRPFLSEQENKIYQAEALGDNALSNNSAYLKQSNQTTQTFKPKLSDALQADVDKIKNNKLLSSDQKRQQVTDLLLERNSEWQRTPIEGGKTNISLSSMMYGVGGLAANLAPFIAAEMVTGGGATASTLRKFTSSFVSAAATGFHDSYVQALEKGSANPMAEAMRVTAINSAALAGASTPEAIKKMIMGGGNPAITSLISKMTDKEIEAALKSAPKALTNFGKTVDGVKKVAGNVASSALEGFKGGAKITAFTTAGQITNDAISGELKPMQDYAKQSLIETLKFGLFGTAAGTLTKSLSKPTDINLAAITEAARNPDAFKRSLDVMEKDGSISPTEANQVRNNIDKAANIFKSSVILKNDNLSENAKREYLYNEMVKTDAKESAKSLPTKQAEQANHEALVADYKQSLLVEPKTQTQLENRKKQLEKQLEPEKKEDGTVVPINEKLKKEIEAELEAVNYAIDDISSKTADENAKRLSNKTESTETTQPVQENVGEPKKQGEKVFEQDGETWTHLTNSKELVDKLLNGEDFIGKGEKLENFVKGVKKDRFNLAHENGTAPYFQKGKFYGKDPTQKYLVVARGDEKFTPNVNHQNADSIEKSSGVGVLNPEFRSAYHFDVYERMPNGDYKKISKDVNADRSELIDKAKEIVPIEGFKNRVFDSNTQLGNPRKGDHISEQGYNYRTLSAKEVDSISKSGGVFPREGKQKGGNLNTKYWTKGNGKNWYGNKDNLETIRVKTDKFNEDEVVKAEDVEVLNKATGKFEPLVKKESKSEPIQLSIDNATEGGSPNLETKTTEVSNTKKKGGNPESKTDETIPTAEEGTGGEKETIVSHAGMQDLADDFGLGDVKSRNPVSDAQDKKAAQETADKWNKEGVYSENIEKLIKNIEDGHGSNPTEKHILQQHIANVRAEASNMDIHDKAYDAKIAKLERLKTAGATLKSTAGATLRTSTLGSISNPTMADWMAERQEVKGEPLTDKEKDETASMFKEYEQRAQEAEQKQKEAEQALADLKAELALKPERERARTIRKKNREALSKERTDIIANIREKLKQSRQETSAVAIPYAKELIAIAPDVMKLVRNLAETGTSKLSDVVDNVHDLLKDAAPNITKRDVVDIIAGKYKEDRKPLSELQKTLRDLKAEAKEISNQEENIKKKRAEEEKKNKEEQDRLDKEFEKEKSEEERKRIQAKIKERKEIDNKLKEKTDDEKVLESAINRNQKSIKDIEEKIRNKDFETKKKTSIDENAQLKKSNPQLWNELQDSRIKLQEAKDAFELAKAKDELNKRGGFRKAFDFASKLISTSKAIKAGIDDSVTFVQLGLAVMANPKSGIKAKIEAFKDINNNRFKRQLAALHNSPIWNTVKLSKLDITEPKSLTKENVEEIYSGNMLDTKIGGKVNLWTYTGGIFERLFTSMGNNLRLNMFVKRIEMLENEGKTFDTHPEEYKAAARVINEMTGRGKVNEHIQSAMPVISPIIWAPKMLASSFNILGLGDIANAPFGKKGFYRSLTPEQRKYAIGQVSKGIGMGVSVMTALAMAGWGVDGNPQSSTFGYVTAPDGNKRYNVFGRYAGVVKTLTQLATGKAKTTEGSERDLDKKGRGSVLFKFMRGKETPFAGLVTDYWLNSQKNSFTGEKIDLKSLPSTLLEPISVSDLRKGMENDGTTSLLTRWLPAVEGIQVQDKRDFVDNLDTLIERNASSDNQEQDKIVNNKDKGRPITDDEFEKYNDARNKKIKDDLTKMYNKGYPIKRGTEVKVVPYKEMTKDEVIKVTTDIKKRATDQTKEELFGKHKKTPQERRADRNLRKLKSTY